MIDKYFQTWIYSRNSLDNELREKQPTVFIAKDEIWAFQWKIKSWKTCIHHRELDLNTYLMQLVVLLMDNILKNIV